MLLEDAPEEHGEGALSYLKAAPPTKRNCLGALSHTHTHTVDDGFVKPEGWQRASLGSATLLEIDHLVHSRSRSDLFRSGHVLSTMFERLSHPLSFSSLTLDVLLHYFAFFDSPERGTGPASRVL